MKGPPPGEMGLHSNPIAPGAIPARESSGRAGGRRFHGVIPPTRVTGGAANTRGGGGSGGRGLGGRRRGLEKEAWSRWGSGLGERRRGLGGMGVV